MGLSHDGIGDGIGFNGYYFGAGNSGPIMGAPFGKDFVHWNNGSYPDANQFQNDVSIIQDKLGNNNLIESYAISLNFDSDDPQDESICLPIKVSNGSIAVICL